MADDVIIIDDYEDSSKPLDIFQIKPLKCNFCGYRTNHKGHTTTNILGGPDIE